MAVECERETLFFFHVDRWPMCRGGVRARACVFFFYFFTGLPLRLLHDDDNDDDDDEDRRHGERRHL
mgnify:CR=1 FL=1